MDKMVRKKDPIFTKDEMEKIKQEAVQRYTDTSWRIYNSTRKKPDTSKEVLANGSIKNSELDISQVDSVENGVVQNWNENENSNTIKRMIPKNENEGRQIVQIETVEVTCEPAPRNIELILHSHDEFGKQTGGGGMNRMITSSSYNGFGETLTSQPKSSRAVSSYTDGMDINLVTERIMSIYFPLSISTRSYRQGQQQSSHMLKNKHGDNYMIFNLTEPKRVLRNEHKHVKEVGWARNLAPPLERLCSVCKEIDSWLAGDEHRIAVLHARGSREKLGVVIAAYMHYSSICGNASQALDRFSMRRYLEDNIGPLQLPSNKRYVDYFAGLLSHNIKINSAPLYLTHVTVLGAPAFQQGGCRAFLKLYEGQTPVYTSGVYNVSSGISQFTVNVVGERRRGLQLRGDILIKCYHHNGSERQAIFQCQFHTCAVADHTLSFTRQQLDIACNDPRFPTDGAVELHFSSGSERHPAPAPTPAVPFKISDDPIVRSSSPLFLEEYEEDDDSDSDDVNHTFGPLDGSIYATIAKKPELSPGAVSSPLTVSMDSGISSAGHQQNANTTASASPPPTAQPSPSTPEDQHRELDELLSDMMLTVQSIPDLKPHQEQSSGNLNSDFNLDNVRYIDEEEDKNIPYHARQDSRPFSYGVNNSTMIADTAKGLSSPSLVRKASVNKSSGDTLNRVQTQVYPDFTTKPVPNFSNPPQYNPPSSYNTLSSKYSGYSSPSPTLRKRDPIDDLFTPSALNAQPIQPIKREFREEFYKDETRRYDPMKRSYTEGTIRRPTEKIIYKTSHYSDSESLSPPNAFRSKSPEFHETYANNNNLTWLQRQQLKLKERKEMQAREERLPYESSLMELRRHQSRHMRPTASHRLDGYTSDTTAFADDDDDYTIPLHINTMYKNGAPTSNYSTIKTTYSTTKTERPFVNIKRMHEKTTQVRDETYHQWRSQGVNSDVETSPSHCSSPRPQTPAFPVHARTPYSDSSTPTVQFDLPNERLPPKSPTTQRKDRPTSPSEMNGSEYIHSSTYRNVSSENQYSPKSPHYNGSSSPTVYYGNSRRSSVNSNEPPHEVSAVHVKFVRDSSKFWYKPSISRDEAIRMLRDQPPGTFVVRDSNSFPGAFGMALKVAQVPSNVQTKAGGDELIRHFLIEPTSRGVRLKGLQNEPVFSSLSALVYQHSVTQMALPCRLILPEGDLRTNERLSNPGQQLLVQGAACNVLYLLTVDMESLTGPQAIKKAVVQLFQKKPLPKSTVVHFKVNGQGITLTDNKRLLFFRKHYPTNTISHCGLDPSDQSWMVEDEASNVKSPHRIFGFVARKPNASNPDNQCHLFAELEPDQPATAICNFVNKMLSSFGVKSNIV